MVELVRAGRTPGEAGEGVSYDRGQVPLLVGVWESPVVVSPSVQPGHRSSWSMWGVSIAATDISLMVTPVSIGNSTTHRSLLD